MKESNNEEELKLAFGMMKEPQWLDTVIINQAHSYRDAVRICWEHRRIKGMTKRLLAALAGLYAPHVTDYLSKDENKRDLPAKHITRFQNICGNRAITQFRMKEEGLTIMERVIDKQKKVA